VKLTAHFSSSAVAENAELYLYSSTYLHGLGLNSAQKHIFLKTEISSLAKRNFCCNRNDCQISVSQSSDVAYYMGCQAISVVRQSPVFFRCWDSLKCC
jgi:hypothetical protein